MADATFDGANLLITLASGDATGVSTIDAEQDIYSPWKEYFKTSDNSKFPLAFRTVGGDTLTASLDAGSYFFLQNDLGWRIKPAEQQGQTINITGNLVAEDSTLPMVVPTSAANTVLILGLQPITQQTNIGQPKQNTALNDFVFTMVLSSDHVTPATGLTVTAERSIDGAAFAATTNSPTEISNGYYSIDLSAADMNGRVISLKFTAATADQREIVMVTSQ
jgi:hypothetical protein